MWSSVLIKRPNRLLSTTYFLYLKIILNPYNFLKVRKYLLIKMSTSGQKSADNTAQCLICMEYEPYLSCSVYLLPCSHVVCRGCLLNIAAVSVEDHPCETCRLVLIISKVVSVNQPTLFGKA